MDSTRATRPGLAATLLACLALAQPAVAQTWGELEVPGGVTAAREVLQLGSSTRTRSALLLDFVRTFHRSADTDTRAIETFQAYFTFVRDLRAALTGWPDGLSLDSTRLARPARDRWRTLAELLALRLREVRNRPVLELARGDNAARRAGWLRVLGIDPADVAARLNRGERVELTVASEAVPLPIPTAWPAIIGSSASPPDIVSIGATRRSALLYVGLMSLDEETLRYAQRHPDLLDINDRQAAVLAAFGASIRIRADRVAVAGGEDFAAAWSGLLDRQPDDVVRFVRRLLDRDDGRVAYFYQAVAESPAPVVRALLAGARSSRDRRDALERHYRVFRDVDSTWKATTRPFYRPAFDPVLAYRLLDVTPEGTVGPGWWPQILERVAGSDDWPDRGVRNLEDRDAGLAAAMRWLFEKDDSFRRFQLLRFAQRQFGAAPRAAAAQVEVALRAFDRMPALALALERMGVGDPGVYADLAQAARRLTTSGKIDEAGPNLWQWQAALAMLEQVHRRRPLAAEPRDAALRALAGTVSDSGHVGGHVGQWVVDHLIPLLGDSAEIDAADEGRVVAGWLEAAGRPRVTLSWEGLDYRVDRSGPVARDAAAIRAATSGPTLGDIVRLVGLARELEAGVTSLEQAKSVATGVQDVARTFASLRDEKNKPRYDTRDLENAARTLSRLRRPRDVTRAARQAPRVQVGVAMATHHVLPSLVYALAVAPTPQPRLFADAVQRHALGTLEERGSSAWRSSAWKLPRIMPLDTGGSGLVGALLGLDVALADTQLRRLETVEQEVPLDGAANIADRDAFVHRIVLAPADGDVAAAARTVTAAIRSGDAGLSGLAEAVAAATPGLDDRIGALVAAVGQQRANLAVWLWQRQRGDEVSTMILPTERFVLGSEAPLPPELGMASLAFDGCLCARPPLRRPVVDWLWRASSGHLSVLVVDLQIKLVEILAALALPAHLMEVLLPMAIQDVLDRAGQYSPDDWEALTAMRFLPAERVEDYLLALIAEGILAPVVPPTGGGR